MYLVDGHNLIGQLQDLSLDDPQDEAKLSMAVRSYCMRANKKATIIFDNGLPGGVSKALSNSQVTVIFAPSGMSADSLLMKRAREFGGLKGNYKEMILVTSDRRIERLAYAYGIETMPSEEFALMLGFRPVEIEPAPEKQETDRRYLFVYEKDPDPQVSIQEIAYWLPIFKRRIAEVRIARRESGETPGKLRKPKDD